MSGYTISGRRNKFKCSLTQHINYSNPNVLCTKNLRNKVIAAITSEFWEATQDKDDGLAVEGVW